jgi:hypothetical protein
MAFISKNFIPRLHISLIIGKDLFQATPRKSMNEYLGAKLLFKTTSGILKGTLKKIDEGKKTMTIEKDDSSKLMLKILLEDIQSLEVIETPKVGQGVFKDPAILRTGNVLESKDIKLKDRTGKEVKSEASKSDLGTFNRSSNFVLEDKAVEEFFTRSFEYFGPSRECFVALASKGITRVVANKIPESSNFTIGIVISGDSLYCEMGYFLARAFRAMEVNCEVITRDTVVGSSIALYRNHFLNSGGEIRKKVEKKYKALIFACESKNVSGDMLSVKEFENIYFLEAKNADAEISGQRTGFVYSIITESSTRFSGTVYLLDCKFSKVVYDLFEITKRCRKEISKIKE